MPDKADLAIGRLGSLFSRLKNRKPIAQAIVAVETGDRSFRWTGADGMTADGDLVVEDTPFFIASIDKLYNATITMMLSETGKLDLDRPLNTYLPPSMISGLHRYHGVNRSEKITVTPETFSAMQSKWHRFGFPLDRAALRSPGWPIEYGTGLMRFRLPRIFSPTASMPSVLGHTGSTGCWLFHCRQLDLFLAGSVDEVTAGAVPFRTVPKILRILRDLR